MLLILGLVYTCCTGSCTGLLVCCTDCLIVCWFTGWLVGSTFWFNGFGFSLLGLKIGLWMDLWCDDPCECEWD